MLTSMGTGTASVTRAADLKGRGRDLRPECGRAVATRRFSWRCRGELAGFGLRAGLLVQPGRFSGAAGGVVLAAGLFAFTSPNAVLLLGGQRVAEP